MAQHIVCACIVRRIKRGQSQGPVIDHHLKLTSHKSTILHEEFPSGFWWENKETHKLSITEGSRLLFEFERTRSQRTTVIHDSAIFIALYTVWTLSGAGDGTSCVLNFSGQ